MLVWCTIFPTKVQINFLKYINKAEYGEINSLCFDDNN